MRGGGKDFRRFQAAEQGREIGRRQGGGPEHSGGDVEPGGADYVLPVERAVREGQQQVGTAGFQQRILGEPGVTRRMTSRRIGALPGRFFGSSICSATAIRKPRRIRRAR